MNILCTRLDTNFMNASWSGLPHLEAAGEGETGQKGQQETLPGRTEVGRANGLDQDFVISPDGDARCL